MVTRMNFFRIIAALTCLWSVGASAQESLSAELIYPPSGVMYTDEVAIVRVIFKTPNALKRALDVSSLANDFEIVAQRPIAKNSGRRPDLATNKTFFVYETELHLQPLRTGAILMPSLRRGRVSSPPIDLQVYPSAGAKGFDGKSRDTFIVSSISNMTPRWGEEVEYRVQTFRKEFKESGSFRSIAPDGAKYRKFDDPVESTRVRNNTNYRTRTRLYKFYPTRTGTVEIPEQEYEITEYIPASSNNRRKRLLRIPARTIQVQPIIGDEDKWLPARSVVITNSWEQEPPVFRKGDAVVMQVAIKIDGHLAEFLPTIRLPNHDENFDVYPTKPRVHPPKQGSLQPILVDYQLTIIPKKEGDHALPEIKLDWWNIKTKQFETSRLTTKLVSVEAGSAAPNINVQSAVTTNSVDGKGTSGIWPWLVLLFALLWLSTLAAALIMYKRLSKQTVASSGSLGPATLPSAPNALKRELRKACEQNNAKQCETLLVKIASVKWRAAFNSLGAVQSQLTPGSLTPQIAALLHHLYGAQGGQFSGAQLWAAFTDDDFVQRVVAKKVATGVIEPL